MGRCTGYQQFKRALGTLYEALLLEHHLNSSIDVNDCVKTSYDQMESDEPRDDNSMDYSDQKELSEEYYTKKFRKVNKEDRRDDDKLRRQRRINRTSAASRLVSKMIEAAFNA
nr:hypothetical protein [Tanacetum cinerariifolium]